MAGRLVCGDQAAIRQTTGFMTIRQGNDLHHHQITIDYTEDDHDELSPRISIPHWPTSNGHVIEPTYHYDVIDFVFVAKRRSRVAWQQT